MHVDEPCKKHDYYPGGRVTMEKSPGEYLCPKCEAERLGDIISHLIILYDLGSFFEGDLDALFEELRPEFKHRATKASTEHDRRKLRRMMRKQPR